MLPALVIAVTVAVAAAALALARHRQLGEARSALTAATARAAEAEHERDELAGTCRGLEQERDRLERERGALERSVRELGEASAERGSALDSAASARAGELEVSLVEATSATEAHAAALDAAVAEVAALERQLGEQRERHPIAPAEVAAACWSLVLARVERQWAAGVAATAEERGVTTGTAAQLAEAVGRELERLREEVGVHADATVSGAVQADPLATLLATGEALAVLAPHAERVQVELGPEVVVVGEEWSGPRTALDRLGGVLAGTGLLRRLAQDGGRVDVVLGPAADDAEPGVGSSP